jgi:O-acetyl-ADP-ribose deacetylase (regulator of RNase III)
MQIQYVQGDLFKLLPYTTATQKFICHVCNNIGGWGSGFVVPLARKWAQTRQAYLDWCQGTYQDGNYKDFRLGEWQPVNVQQSNEQIGGIYVCNMIGQNGVVGPENPKPIRYAALAKCMDEIGEHIVANARPSEIHAPKFGAGLAGGNWDFIEELINECWIGRGTGKSRGFGFVEMENEADANAAIKALNGSQLNGRNIIVNEAKPQR